MARSTTPPADTAHPRRRRRSGRGMDSDWPEVERAYSRYSATEQAERDRGDDQRRHVRHGHSESRARPGYEPEPGVYDPDHEYRRYDEGDHEGGDRGPSRDHYPGPYRGVGPKNYTRSDRRIHEDVCDRLTEDPYIDARDIEVQVKDGEITLAGTVDSRRTRRRTEDLAEQVLGATHVQNDLRVARGRDNEGPAGLGRRLSELS
ncbi:MAG: BON domain-containing protein [Reyranella sp.]|nr:BON domain-containing protein [Reyranella sp.]